MIAVVSDSPTLTTGFGRTTSHVAGALHASGWDVSCFGFKARRADIPADWPYQVWAAEQGGHWTEQVAPFLDATQPEALVVNSDAYNSVEVVAAVRGAGYHGPIVSYVVFDGLPVGSRYLDVQRSCDAVIASSETAAAYLRANGVSVVSIAPPGVDPADFRPEPDRDALRERAGVADAFVIGVFGVNSERKQIARVVAALPEISRRVAPRRTLLYLHCRSVGFWRLADLAQDFGVADQVLFPALSAFDEARGIPTSGSSAVPATCTEPAGSTLPPGLSYVDRLNICDVIVNVPHSGDIEQVILEAQACGVPLVHTDDDGIMAEAVGAGGVLLPSADVGIGRIGERVHHVARSEIVESVAGLLLDEGARAHQRHEGLANAAKYPWTTLESAICEAITAVVGSKRADHR